MSSQQLQYYQACMRDRTKHNLLYPIGKPLLLVCVAASLQKKQKYHVYKCTHIEVDATVIV